MVGVLRLDYSSYDSTPGLQWPWHGVDHSPTSMAEVKKKSRAIPALPVWDLLACSRVTFTFNFMSHLRHCSSKLPYDLKFT